MSELFEFTSVHCPFDRVPEYLRAFLRERGTESKDGASIDLHVPMIGDVSLERSVTLSIWAKEPYPGFERVGVVWSPKGGGPYPVFSGTLVAQDEGAGFSRLEIAGGYTPPFGPAGKLFDAIAGKKIAHATVTDLLAQLKVALEERAATTISQGATS